MLCLVTCSLRSQNTLNGRYICLILVRSNSPDCVLEHRQPEPVRGILLPYDAYLARYIKRWRQTGRVVSGKGFPAQISTRVVSRECDEPKPRQGR